MPHEPLDKKVSEFLSAISTNEDLKEAHVKIKDKKIDRVNYITRTETPQKAKEIIYKALEEKGYKELLIKQENGKVVLIERIDKK